MSSSIPPVGPPKATVTHEFGDVRVTVRGDLTPAEAIVLAGEILIAASAGVTWRNLQLQLIEEAWK